MWLKYQQSSNSTYNFIIIGSYSVTKKEYPFLHVVEMRKGFNINSRVGSLLVIINWFEYVYIMVLVGVHWFLNIYKDGMLVS